MKLNKLTSAVSISLAALVLTACGNDNNTPNTNSQNIVNDNQAQIDKAIKEAEEAKAKAEKARQEAEKAKAEAEKAKAEAEQAKENIAKENNPVAEIAEINSTIKSFDVTKKPSVGGANYIRSEGSDFDRSNNPLQSGGNIVPYSERLQDRTLSNFVAASQSIKGADGKTRIYKNILGAVEARPGLNNNLIFDDYGAGSEGTTIQNANNSNVVIGGTGSNASVEHKALYLAGVDVGSTATALIPTGTQVSNTNLANSGLIISNAARTASNYALREGLVVTAADSADAGANRINNQTTRVFGRAFNNADLANTANPNTYKASFSSNDGFVGLTTAKLSNVQYGRLTSTLDTITQPGTADIDKQYIARDFANRSANNSVDYYFYRGVNETSIADMAKVKAAGVDINYRGHALVYGRDPVSGHSNAVGNASTIGNFVQATYKTATGDVNGSIYNLLVPEDAKTKANITKNDLISFSGKVNGNTVEGSATRLADNDNGSFVGSFYGQNARELGGSINSIDKNVVYGDAKWGAVFGAQSDAVSDLVQTLE